MELSDWINKNTKPKSYAHFDERIKLDDVYKYITNPEKISQHGFYPLISYDINFTKYRKGSGINPKTRKIMYSSHIDRYIYSYYGFLLNGFYNDFVLSHDTDSVAVAYRNNKQWNNITLAKSAFDQIKKHVSSYVIVGDFTNFFDKLDHNYLKEKLKQVMNTDILPDDYYAVFKNITKYTEWPMNNLLKFHDLKDTVAGRSILNRRARVLNKVDFKKHKKSNIIANSNNFGIPQGSAISAVLSNIYMVDFDIEMNKLVKRFDGYYMRYCDDIIIILPKGSTDISNFYNLVVDSVNSIPQLELETNKTNIYDYSNSCVVGEKPDKFLKGVANTTRINYLGFSFDGRDIYIRDKTVSKYYYRMYRKAKAITRNEGYTKFGNKISKKNLYQKYSVKGTRNGHRNFITYALRSESVFNDEDKIKSVSRRHMAKIKNRIKVKI